MKVLRHRTFAFVGRSHVRPRIEKGDDAVSGKKFDKIEHSECQRGTLLKI